MTFLLLNLLQTRTRISWVVIAAAVIALAAGIALLVYFYKRYKRIEKETEEDWDASRHSLFVSARPTQPKTELTDAAAPMEAEPPVSEREPVKAGGTREFASDLNLAAFTPAANLEPEPLAEAPAPEVPVPAQPPASAEPRQTEILASLLPRNLAIQVFRAMLENAASEQGARMAAMDSATRNAGDMINGLTLKYNRSRQAIITKELIEIISGAEAI